MDGKKLGWGLVALVIVAVTVFLGVSYPIPPPPAARVLVADEYKESLIVGKVLTNRGTLDVTGASTFAGAVTVNNNATVTGGLTLTGVAVSGPVRFGSASTVVTGTTIAHGLATTPTMAVLTAGAPITTPLYITARNATSLTVGINDGVTVGTVFWLAGK